MSYGERKRLLTSFIEEVWSQGRIEACDDYIGATYTVRHDPGDPWDGQTLSLSGFKERVRLSRAPFPDQRFALETILEDGNAVATAWTWAASHKGDVAGFSATGARLTMSGLTIYDFDDANRILGHWQVADRLSVFQHLGQNAARR
ncbi:MAG TPA: ester cyclase [Rhizomicrobium sp.]|jgi:predicted ester cyclase|nr:ester cyclase [Rhizomicrobium sp.]